MLNKHTVILGYYLVSLIIGVILTIVVANNSKDLGFLTIPIIGDIVGMIIITLCYLDVVKYDRKY